MSEGMSEFLGCLVLALLILAGCYRSYKTGFDAGYKQAKEGEEKNE